MTALPYLAYAFGAIVLLQYVYGIACFRRFMRQANVRNIPKGDTPPISLLKPLYGMDDRLAENLTATLRQNYPEFEVLFLHEREDDPALAAVDEAMQAVPDVEARKIAGRAPDIANPKVAVLIRGQEEARYDIIAAADSDVCADPLYLRDIANGLEDADAVSFAPVLFGTRTLWGRAMAMLVNCEGLLGAAGARGAVTTGATIAVRREALEAIGGYAAVADEMADDYALGRALRKAGKRLTLARRAARVRVGPAGASWALRWLRTVRSAAPVGYASMLPTVAAPLLLLFTGGIGWVVLGGITLLRCCIAVVVDFRFCWDRSLIRALPLLPLLWILEPLGWLLGWFGGHVTWRGRRYRLKRGRAKVVGP